MPTDQKRKLERAQGASGPQEPEWGLSGTGHSPLLSACEEGGIVVGPGLTPHAVCPQVEVSPLENAIQVVENKNQELRALISQYQHKQVHGNINLLSMCLNGVIDAAVNGGIARYQEVSWPSQTRPGTWVSVPLPEVQPLRAAFPAHPRRLCLG